MFRIVNVIWHFEKSPKPRAIEYLLETDMGIDEAQLRGKYSY